MSLYLTIIYLIFQLYFSIMILSIFFSWFPNIYKFKICRIVDEVSNWYLKPFHGIIIIGPFDFTTIIGLGIYQFIMGLVINILL